MKFEEGKTYLVERSHKAFGGGLYEIKIEKMIGKEYIKADGKWNSYEGFVSEWIILADLTENKDLVEVIK